jgi:nucleoside-diphosphate-sugar epimerase
LIWSKPLNLSGRKLFITGGTGFLGRSLLDYLIESEAFFGSNFHTTVLSRNPDSFLERYPVYAGHLWLSFVKGDLLHLPLTGGDFTDIIHGAADTHSDGDPIAWFDQIVEGTRRILDFGCASGVERLLLMSSGAVYGKTMFDIVELEECITQAPLPNDAKAVYAHGKRMAETLCTLYNENRDMGCVIARCFTVLSEHVPLGGQYAAGNFLRDALDPLCDSIFVKSDGSSIRSYLDGRDMAHWTFTLLRSGIAGEAYNMGSDQGISIRELAESIVQLVAPKKTVLIGDTSGRSEKSSYLPSITKTKALGLSVETNLDESILKASAALCKPISDSKLR